MLERENVNFAHFYRLQLQEVGADDDISIYAVKTSQQDIVSNKMTIPKTAPLLAMIKTYPSNPITT